MPLRPPPAHELARDVEALGAPLETAIVTIAVWSRLPASEVTAEALARTVHSIGQRFCVSKSVTELMAAAGDSNPQV